MDLPYSIRPYAEVLMRPRSTRLLCLSLCFVGAYAIHGVKAAGENPLAPIGSFADYSIAKDYSSFDQNEKANKERLENGDGEVPRVEKKSSDSVRLNAASAQAQVTVPLGWYAIDQGDKTVIFTADEATRFILHFQMIAKPADFGTFKSDIAEQMKSNLKQPGADCKQFDLPDGSTAVELSHIATRSGKENGMVVVFTPCPKNSHLAAIISLTTPQDQLHKYEGLLGLILKERRIYWPETD